MPVRLRRLRHELREFINCKGDVRACEVKILKTTNDLTKSRSISRWRAIIEHKTIIGR